MKFSTAQPFQESLKMTDPSSGLNSARVNSSNIENHVKQNIDKYLQMMVKTDKGEKIMSRMTSQIYNSAVGIGLGNQNENSIMSVDVRRHSSPV